jgi:hypothetical protein
MKDLKSIENNCIYLSVRVYLFQLIFEQKIISPSIPWQIGKFKHSRCNFRKF